MKKAILLLLLLWALTVPAWGTELPREVRDALPAAAEDITEHMDDSASFSEGLSLLWERACGYLTDALRESISGGVLLLAAAVAGSLVACTPDGGKNRYNIDLNDMNALSREYLAPLAAMGDIYWSGYQELKSGPLLKYAIYELYGYTGEEKLDLAAAYGLSLIHISEPTRH